MMYRIHHKIPQKDIIPNKSLNNNLIDVSNYPDMQELLYEADILITDYSSSMWDFSLMNKPCFIYAVDVAKYTQTRDFYTPMKEWPFPLATNIDELIDNINSFDITEYSRDVKKHHKELGSFESGHATESVVEYINRICFS